MTEYQKMCRALVGDKAVDEQLKGQYELLAKCRSEREIDMVKEAYLAGMKAMSDGLAAFVATQAGPKR